MSFSCNGLYSLLRYYSKHDFHILDDLHRVLKECNTKYTVTVPALADKVKDAQRGLHQIKVHTCLFLYS